MRFNPEKINKRDVNDAERLYNYLRDIAYDIKHLYSMVYEAITSRNREGQFLRMQYDFTNNRIKKLSNEIAASQEDNTVKLSIGNLTYSDLYTPDAEYPLYIDNEFSMLTPHTIGKDSKLYRLSSNPPYYIDSSRSSVAPGVHPKIGGKVIISTKDYPQGVEISDKNQFYPVIDGDLSTHGVLWSMRDLPFILTKPNSNLPGANIIILPPKSNNPISNYIELLPFPVGGVNIDVIKTNVTGQSYENLFTTDYFVSKTFSSGGSVSTGVNSKYIENASRLRYYFKDTSVQGFSFELSPNNNSYIYGMTYVDIGKEVFVDESYSVIKIEAKDNISRIEEITIEGFNLDQVEISLMIENPAINSGAESFTSLPLDIATKGFTQNYIYVGLRLKVEDKTPCGVTNIKMSYSPLT